MLTAYCGLAGDLVISGSRKRDAYDADCPLIQGQLNKIDTNSNPTVVNIVTKLS